MTLKYHKCAISLDDLMREVAIEEEHKKDKPNLMSINASANIEMKQKWKDCRGKTKIDSTM